MYPKMVYSITKDCKLNLKKKQKPNTQGYTPKAISNRNLKKTIQFVRNMSIRRFERIFIVIQYHKGSDTSSKILDPPPPYMYIHGKNINTYPVYFMIFHYMHGDNRRSNLMNMRLLVNT